MSKSDNQRASKQASNIYLIGPMGAGKTTIGKQLAKSLQLPFYDSDREIEKQTGVSVSTIFEYEGEEGFREREQNMIQKLTQLNGVVLATGGGTILMDCNRQLLQANGFVVYLQCSVDKLVQRTGQNTDRPLLYVDGSKAGMAELVASREAFYLACANFKIDGSETPSKKVAKTIVQAYRANKAKK